ncbi:MAG: glycosyltransferase family 4 protein [Blastocatellia bacterium]
MGPYPPPHGGVQTNLVAIRRFLMARGIPCSVINLTRHRDGKDADVHFPKNSLHVLRLLLRLKYDIIHMHIGGTFSLRLLLLGLACCLMPRSKAVLTFHSGGYPQSAEGKTARPFTLRGFIFRRFERIIGVNRELVELFERFGVPKGRLHMILPHSVSLPPSDTALPDDLARFLQTHSPNLVTVSGLEPEYDIPSQIEGLGSVRERFPNAGLLIIGGGSMEKEMRREIGSKPYADHILMCGDLPHSAALRAIVEGDVFLRTTLYDGDSISVREALAAGTPVIATDNGMRPEGVHLIPRSDVKALSLTIERLLTHSNGSAPRGGESGEENIEAVHAIYRDLMKEAG